jgi:hypothetical protein
MTHTVICPECHLPAHVVDTFTVQRPTGPATFLRVQCEGPLSFLISADEIDSDSRSLPIDGTAAGSTV